METVDLGMRQAVSGLSLDMKADHGVGVGMNDDGDRVNDGGGVEVEQDDQDGKMVGLGDDLGVTAGMDDNDQSDQSDTGRKWSEIVTGVVSDSQEGVELDAQGKRMKDVDHGVRVGIDELELGWLTGISLMLEP